MPILDQLKSGSFKKVLGNFLSLSILNIVNYIFPLLIIPILINRLGVENYGIYIYAFTVLNYFNLVVQYGFNFSATNKIAKNQDNVELISITYSSVMIIRLLLSFVLILGLLLCFLFVPEVITIYLFGIGIFLGQGLIPIWLFQGLEKMKFITIINLVVRVIAFLLIYFFVNETDDMNLLMLFQSLSFLVGAFVAMFIIYKKFKVKLLLPSILQLKSDLIDGWQLFLSTIGVNFYRESNIIILGLVTNFTIVGYYAPAEKLVKAIQSFSNIIVTALYPHFSKRFGSASKASSLEVFNKVGYLLGILFFVCSLIICFLSPYIINLYLGSFQPNTVWDLRILSFIIFFGGLNYYYGIIGLVNFGEQKYFSKAVWVCGIISIFVCIILSKFYNDIGAGIAMVVAELILCIMIFNKLRK